MTQYSGIYLSNYIFYPNYYQGTDVNQFYIWRNDYSTDSYIQLWVRINNSDSILFSAIMVYLYNIIPETNNVLYTSVEDTCNINNFQFDKLQSIVKGSFSYHKDNGYDKYDIEGDFESFTVQVIDK